MKCQLCGRALKNKKSLDRGYGVCCYKKHLNILSTTYNLKKWLGEKNESG